MNENFKPALFWEQTVKICETKLKEPTADWKEPSISGQHNLYFAPNIIMEIKSRKLYEQDM